MASERGLIETLSNGNGNGIWMAATALASGLGSAGTSVILRTASCPDGVSSVAPAWLLAQHEHRERLGLPRAGVRRGRQQGAGHRYGR